MPGPKKSRCNISRNTHDGPKAKHQASPADKAYGAAASFIHYLGTLAYHARKLETCRSCSDDWRSHAYIYAHAFIAWFDLSYLLTSAVSDAACRVYQPGSPSIKLGKFRAKPTVIEAVSKELGIYFRNVLYQDRRCPLDPNEEKVAEKAKAQATARQVAQGKPAEPLGWGDDFDELMKYETRTVVRKRLGIKKLGDALILMANEWVQQDPEQADAKFAMLRCGSIDFEDLETQLDREARAVLALENDSMPASLAVLPDDLSKADDKKIVFPIENYKLANLLKMETDTLSKQIQKALQSAGKAVKKVGRGKKREWSERELRDAYPLLPDGKLKIWIDRNVCQTDQTEKQTD